jgi:hypothetical protein
MATDRRRRRQDDQEAKPEVVRPAFRPRVIVKFHDWVAVPYEDGAEEHIAERFGQGVWDKFEAEYGRLTLTRLITAVPPGRLQEIVEQAAEHDKSYRPHNFFTWFTIDTPDGLRSEDFARILMGWEIVETAYSDAPPIDPFPVTPGDDPRSANQGYLDPAPDGVDAEYAWTVAGGDGAGQRFIDLEQGWTLDHEDLVGLGPTLLFGTLVDSSRSHGTAVFGEVFAVDNTLGCVGIAPGLASADATSHSGSFSNVSSAIVAAIDTIDFGHVLLLEMQTVPATGVVFGAPIEILDDIFEAVRLATALGIVVVEAAGNGSNDLDAVNNLAGKQVLNPASADFRDSGAIIVGAASSTVPHTRMNFSSYGSRVDCYAWGENVDTTSSNSTGSTTLYTSTFGGTSSASPIIAGAALAVQGILEASGGYRLSPVQMRDVLSATATGTASATPATDLIGVMPDLRAVITTTLNVGFSDVYLRDHPGDTGDPHVGAISTSPDIILRPDVVPNPQLAYGEGSGTEASSTLGYEAESGQDNYIYARVRNRGDVAAVNATVAVYWSEVATLITPDMWNLIGSDVLVDVPVGDVLTVTDGLTWQAADIPATGHYCFVATVGTADDPVPPLANLIDFDNFMTFIRNNNNVTWRNFNIVSNVPDAADPGVLMPFVVAGAPDRAVPMALEIIAKLPEGARLHLEAPAFLFDRWGLQGPQLERDRDRARVPLRPQGRQTFGAMRFPAQFRAKLRLVADLPKKARQQDGWQVIARQVLAEGQEEVGRVTWHLVAPDFFDRRRRFEECVLAKLV